PSDRYDARLQLVLLLMADEQLDAAAEVERVSTRASSSSSLWAFARALLKFQREGDSVFARRALAEAIILYPEETEVFRNAFDAIADLGSTETSGSGHPDPVHTRVYQELVRELSSLLSMDGAPLDPVDDRATLVAIAASTALWLAVAGASAWFLAVRAEGPSVRYDNRRLGDGPLLSITIDKLTKYRHCPHCHKPTKFHPTDLVLHLEDGPIIDSEVNARVCESCDVVCIAVEDIARQIIMQRPEAYGRDFISLGFIPESERGSGSGADWLSEHARPWRQIDDYDSFREDWPTIESQLYELDSLLHSAGITGLLGPMSHR
ncbi:MAG: hypothetical protein IT336_09660, partial [Thermomicrobiales bacterium]|nr:hypothetical protein [Thermomicrobiales bacterium]